MEKVGRNEKKWLVSIVMSVYNVESYIVEAIESLLKQDINFEKSIQLILVNDGSTDNSGEICKDYAERYPKNILYFEKENGGQSSARNKGLEYISGKYINFMDPDDTLSDNAISEAINFFEQNYAYVDMVAIPLIYFEAQTGLHGKYEGLGKKNRIISLIKEPSNFILSAASSFYKADFLQDLRFDEKLMTEEDTKFNLTIIRRTLSIGYVCENDVQYNYRRRYSGGSNVDILSSGANVESLMAPIYIFEDLFDYEHELAPYEKELIVYELRSRFRVMKKELLAEEKYKMVISAYSKWIEKIDCDFITKSRWLETIEKKVLFLKVSGRSFGDFVRRGFSDLSDRLIKTCSLEFIDEKVALSCRFNNFGEDDFDLVLVSETSEKVIFADKKTDINGPYDSEIGEFQVDKTHIRTFHLPLENEQYQFCYYDLKNGKIVRISRNVISGKCRAAANLEKVGPIYKGFSFCIANGKITVTDNREIISARNVVINQSARRELVARTFDGLKKYILISDRPDKAGDNGEALFNYIMKNESEEIKRNTFFVIKKSCADYVRMKYKTHIIEFRSTEHIDKFINAKIIYSSHNAVNFYYPFDAEEYKYYADLLQYKFVWLQHGITKDNISKAANKLNTLDNAVVTATRWETNEFSRPNYLYDKDDILSVGFARFDELVDCPQKIITVAPTWRLNLVGHILPNGHNEPKEFFEESDFYKNYMSFLTSDKLIDFLRINGYQLQFVLHAGFTCYEHMFEAINNDVIKLRHMNDFSYKQAFSESSLFITDFSSTAFDFAYLGKPIIYFQFDEEDFFEKHYKKSSWRYKEDGFGPVITDVDELIDEIVKSVKSECKMDQTYLDRVNSSFIYRDHNNCKRIMDATRKWCLQDTYDFESIEKKIYALEHELKESLILKDKELEFMREQVEVVNQNKNDIQYCLDETRKSFSYRLGYKLTTIPRYFRSKIKGKGRDTIGSA